MKDPLHILLVDDDEDDRELFVEAVNEVDPDIICIGAKDAEEAMSYLREAANATPDFIFLDLRMPRIDGRKCLQMLRAEKRLENVPVIIYTTSNDEEDCKKLMEMGATHFTTKPSNPEEIYYIVSMIVNEQWEKD